MHLKLFRGGACTLQETRCSSTGVDADGDKQLILTSRGSTEQSTAI